MSSSSSRLSLPTKLSHRREYKEERASQLPCRHRHHRRRKRTNDQACRRFAKILVRPTRSRHKPRSNLRHHRLGDEALPHDCLRASHLQQSSRRRRTSKHQSRPRVNLERFLCLNRSPANSSPSFRLDGNLFLLQRTLPRSKPS